MLRASYRGRLRRIMQRAFKLAAGIQPVAKGSRAQLPEVIKSDGAARIIRSGMRASSALSQHAAVETNHRVSRLADHLRGTRGLGFGRSPEATRNVSGSEASTHGMRDEGGAKLRTDAAQAAQGSPTSRNIRRIQAQILYTRTASGRLRRLKSTSYSRLVGLADRSQKGRSSASATASSSHSPNDQKSEKSEASARAASVRAGGRRERPGSRFALAPVLRRLAAAASEATLGYGHPQFTGSSAAEMTQSPIGSGTKVRRRSGRQAAGAYFSSGGFGADGHSKLESGEFPVARFPANPLQPQPTQTHPQAPLTINFSPTVVIKGGPDQQANKV